MGGLSLLVCICPHHFAVALNFQEKKRIDITDMHMADTTDFLIPLMHGVMVDEY